MSLAHTWSNCLIGEKFRPCPRWVAIVVLHVPAFSNTNAPAMPNGKRLSRNLPRHPNSTDLAIEHDAGCRAGRLRFLSCGTTRPLRVACSRGRDSRPLDKTNP